MIKGPDLTRGLAARRLDFEHICASSGQQLAAELSLFICEFQDFDIKQKSIHTAAPRKEGQWPSPPLFLGFPEVSMQPPTRCTEGVRKR